MAKKSCAVPNGQGEARKVQVYVDLSDLQTAAVLGGFDIEGRRKPWAKVLRWMINYVLSRESIGRNLAGEPHVEPGSGLTLVYIPTKAINHIKGCFKDYMNLDVTDGQLAAFIEDGIYGQIGARFGPHLTEEPFEDEDEDDDDDANYAQGAR